MLLADPQDFPPWLKHTRFVIGSHHRNHSWALLPQILLGLTISAVASVEAGNAVTVWKVLCYFMLLACGVAILYSLLVVLTATSVWTVRHSELYELWFYMLQFGNYPEEVYRGSFVGAGVRIILTYALPILLAVNVPAQYGAMLLTRWEPVAGLGVATVLALLVSRWFFRIALRSYSSASS